MFSACVDARYDIKENIKIFNKQCNEHFMNTFTINKTPAQAFTPLADEKKMGTMWIFATTPSTAQARTDAGISWS